MKRTVEKEQYFTTPHLARQCVDRVERHWPLLEFDLVVEPSAGDGAFFDLLPRERRTGLDIDPRHPELVEADFLTWRPPATAGRVLTIGNPPFGQRAALAVAFLKHACAFSDVVAFILPRSFNKYTFQDRVDPYFHLTDSFNCEGFVDISGQEVAVKTVFQVWERRVEPRVKVDLAHTHPHFSMRHAHLSRISLEDRRRLREEYDFALPQVGAKFLPKDVHDVVKGSYWFIKGHVPGVHDRFRRLNFGFLADMNVAHTSLSKKDIVAAYASVLEAESWVGERDAEPAVETLF